MPAPTTHTSAVASAVSGENDGTFAVSDQTGPFTWEAMRLRKQRLCPSTHALAQARAHSLRTPPQSGPAHASASAFALDSAPVGGPAHATASAFAQDCALVNAFETLSRRDGSVGKPLRDFSATLTPSTQIVNSPRPPGSIAASACSLSLINAATRAARGS